MLWLTVLPLLLSCPAAPDGAAPLFLELKPIKTRVSLHGPVMVDVVVHNVSKRKLTLPSLMKPPHYWIYFSITDPDGERIYDATLINPYWQEAKLELLPGSFFGTSLDLAFFYAFKKAGEYRISATYGRPPTHFQAQLVPLTSSATVTITLER